MPSVFTALTVILRISPTLAFTISASSDAFSFFSHFFSPTTTEYRSVGADAHARGSAAGQVDRQQPDIILRVRDHINVPAGLQFAVDLRGHFGREYQCDNRDADAGAGSDTQRTGRVRQFGVVDGLDPDIACACGGGG